MSEIPPVGGAGLVARTRPLDIDVDMVALAGDDGVLMVRQGLGLAGRGVALRVPVRLADGAEAAKQVQQALLTIHRDDPLGRPGTGAVALGALPFDRAAPGSLTVPALAVGRDEDGTRWVTTVHPGGRDPLEALAEALEASPGPTPVRSPLHFSLTAERDPQDWCEAVARARGALVGAAEAKVVLARAVDVEADQPLGAGLVLERLARSYPTCHLFLADGFLGASPELLVARRSERVRCHPMAGTAPRSSEASADARLAAGLLASAKDRREHQITIDMVHDTLLEWCSYLDWQPEPEIVAVANVQHLATLMEGRLSEPAPSVIELVAALHPTPAVGGHPRDEALALIAELEHLDRGRYAGTVGWVDAAGNGTWAVAIRCAQLDGCRARCFAGVGVVADSDPDQELEETRNKLQALLSALVRP